MPRRSHTRPRNNTAPPRPPPSPPPPSLQRVTADPAVWFLKFYSPRYALSTRRGLGKGRGGHAMPGALTSMYTMRHWMRVF